MDPLSVELISVPVKQIGWGAVQGHATVTLTALTKVATLSTINVDWIRTALIGQSAVRSLNAGMARVTAIMIGNVKACLCVAMISVEMDHQQWTVV